MDTATTSVYKFQDPIENLQIKITLRKQPIIDATLTNPNLASLPLSSSSSLPSSSMVEMKSIEKPRRFKSTSYIFKWQEKVFSKREVEYYSDLDARTRHNRDPDSDRDNPLLVALPPIIRKHLEEFQEQNIASQQQGKGPLKGQVVCSLVDEDVHPTNPNPAQPPHEELTPLARNLQMPLRNQESATGVSSFTTAHPIVRSKPVKGIHRHLHETPFRTFTLVAAMRKRTQENVGEVADANQNRRWEGHEYVLCTVRAYENGTLELRPGFTKDINKPYSLKTDDVFTTYEYYIENYTPFPVIKAPMSNAPPAVPERPLVGAPFVQGPVDPSDIRIHVFAEIILAKGFSSTPLFVEYVVELPEKWRHYYPDEPLDEGNDDSAPLNGFSQFGRCKPDPDDPTSSVTHFGFPFEVHAEGPENEHFPKVYFVVHTQDYWDRHQVLGYGYALIPRTSGRCEIDISMWRPLGSVRSQLRSFFIGASPELHNTKYVASTKSENYNLSGNPKRAMSKYGFRTVSSGGFLKIRMECAFQQRPPEPEKKEGDIGVSLSSQWGRAPDTAVLHALARAKQRIEMIKSMKKDQ
eukprot:Phypoly_transcript_05327.p1 GENE.Phypoly_transcript_05327~~Phypoly_transcript_05327.p1  ORF type:complete len:579 (+),score=81.21 Phypoly_transcript_05327:169-1905(+)